MSDLISLIQQFDATWNRHDLEAALNYFSDDAVVTTVPSLPGAPPSFRGKNEIRGFVQMLIPNFHVNSKDFAQQGNKVTWFATITSDSVRAMGVDALDTTCEAIIENGKVKAFMPTFTEESLAKLAAAQQKA